MHYKLHDEIGLRGWDGSPYALRHFPSGRTEFVGEDFFQALSFCDGGFDCDSPLLTPLHRQLIGFAVKKGAAVPCEEGSGLAERQKYRLHPCKYISTAHWSITGKCNMRCRHCYMSAPQAKYGEISTQKALEIVNQIAAAGIAKVNLTGGEPLVRSDFWEIVDALRERDIVIEQVYTNGLLVNEALLGEFERRGMRPEFSLSFDGVGWHDWLRGYEGAEKDTVRAIKLLRSRNFPVGIESAFHRDSIGAIGDTMRLLGELGVSSWKTNPAAGSGNWLNESRDLDLAKDELYDAYLKLIPEYFAAGSPLSVQLGGFFSCEKGGREYIFPSKKPYTDEEKRLREPLCGAARNMMYISADVRLLPCMPLAGLPVQDEYPSLHGSTIAEALNSSIYLERISAPISELFGKNDECAACEHRLPCNGGCRSAALSENNGADYFGKDSWTCHFFKGGYEERIKEVCKEYEERTKEACKEAAPAMPTR
ncbi:MAG: radical SAM protein [Holophagales bacterium]|jgi:radical SAM protein with 4Fe4S-binding SPASM domain|nr:radical SAM protein [Holophagales bacterium]